MMNALATEDQSDGHSSERAVLDPETVGRSVLGMGAADFRAVMQVAQQSLNRVHDSVADYDAYAREERERGRTPQHSRYVSHENERKRVLEEALTELHARLPRQSWKSLVTRIEEMRSGLTSRKLTIE
jgi:hypothetical protein